MYRIMQHSPENDRKKLKSWLRLIRTENVGPVHFHQLLHRFKSAENALKNIPKMALRAGRKNTPTIPSEAEIEEEIEQASSRGIRFLTSDDALYPTALKVLSDAPPVLSLWGKISLLSKELFAIVGTRHASVLGRKMASECAEALGSSYITVVSGLAQGIDTEAHKASLPFGTIAVLAQGIDYCYPPENEALYAQIKEEGLLISETPLGTSPHPTLFPRRNRIISGLSWGTLVVEAALKSGSLITARYAADQGRQVFAVPGHPKDPRAQGTNKLIREGATLTQSVEDILEERPATIVPYPSVREYEEDDTLNLDDTAIEEACRTVLSALSPAPISMESLAVTLGMPIALLRTALLELSIAGFLESDVCGQIAKLPQNTEKTMFS